MHPQEHRPELARAATLQIPDQRLADIDRQRQPVQTVALPANDQLTTPPVEILELHRGNLPGAQPEPHQQQQDRVIPPSDRPPPVAAGQQAAHDPRLDPARQGPIPQIRHAGNRPHQRRGDQPRHVQIPQQRPQAGHQIPRSRHAPPRTLTRQKPAHLGGRQPLELPLVRQLLQEQPRDALIAGHRQRRQPALAHQVLVIAREHLHPRPVRHHRHRRRHRPDLPQIRKRQCHACRRDPRRVPRRATLTKQPRRARPSSPWRPTPPAQTIDSSQPACRPRDAPSTASIPAPPTNSRTPPPNAPTGPAPCTDEPSVPSLPPVRIAETENRKRRSDPHDYVQQPTTTTHPSADKTPITTPALHIIGR